MPGKALPMLPGARGHGAKAIARAISPGPATVWGENDNG